MDPEEIEKQFETILERLLSVERRLGETTQKIATGKQLIEELTNNVQLKNNQIEGAVQRLQDWANDLKAVDKSQTETIEEFISRFNRVDRNFEGLISRLDGGQGEDWTIEKIRTTVRNSAFTARLLQGTIGVLGLGGVATVAATIFGVGQGAEEEFVTLATHIDLISRVDKLERVVDQWEVPMKLVLENIKLEPENANNETSD